MKPSQFVLLALLVAVSCVPVNRTQTQPDRPFPFVVPAALGTNLPLRFEANIGQCAPEVAFVARTARAAMLIAADGIEVVQPHSLVRLRVEDALDGAVSEGLDPLEVSVSYLVGDDPSGWRSRVPTFGRVACRSVRPGVDLVVSSRNGKPEYDLVCDRAADAELVTFAVTGADALRIDDRGALVVETADGPIVQPSPTVFQHTGSGPAPVACGYRLVDEHRFRFELADCDADARTVVDPQLLFSTYLGGYSPSPLGGGRDTARAVAVDSAGNVYVAGYTLSTDFPTTVAAVQRRDPDGTAVLNGSDAFVAKLNPATSTLIYVTYLGGFGDDEANDIGVDAEGNAYVTGFTKANNFPTANPLQPANAGGYENQDAFLAKLAPGGDRLVYSTYLGGATDSDGTGGNDEASGLALDPSGAVYLTGRTSSPSFPRIAAMDGTFDGTEDAFVTKINATGSALIYSTYLGGSSYDQGRAIAVDSSGSAYVTGLTASLDFPTRNAVQPVNGGGYEDNDAFVAKLAPAGNQLVYSTFLGGQYEEIRYEGGGIAVDDGGNAYITGTTYSPDFPTFNAFQPSIGGDPADFADDAYVVKLGPDGSSFAFSTYLGGNDYDGGGGVAVDSAGRVYVAGSTSSPDFPFAGALQSLETDYGDAYLAIFDASGRTMVFATPIGGELGDYAYDVAVDQLGNAYVVGTEASDHFPTLHPTQANNRYGFDAFITVIGDRLATPPPVIVSVTGVSKPGKPYKLKIAGSNFQNGVQAFIGEQTTAWPSTKLKNSSTFIVKGGTTLEAALPVGTPVTIRLRNTDGGEATTTFTR